MKEFKCISIESRDELRAWLAANHTRTESIWLVTFKKYITDKHVLWAEVVEEALCFGWIDSRPRKLDADRTMLLSPRRPGSPWSRLNKQRVEKLLAAKLMMPSGLVAIEQAQKGRFVQTERIYGAPRIGFEVVRQIAFYQLRVYF
jgi:uncharacterized protein YdeI (YjbR/CyaY-like superfamily)